MIYDFTALDVESTGLNPKTDKLIEIGAVKVRNGKITDRFHTLVYPGRKLEERITQLTGITDEMLKDAPVIEEVIPLLLDFIGEDVLLGHRILFDFSFIKKAAANQKLSFEKKGIDTLKIARRFLPELESKRLSFLCEYFEIPIDAHKAESDARAAAMLYFKLAEKFGGEDGFEALPLIYKVKKESPATPRQKERLYKLVDMHKLIIDYDIDGLTKSEASRITDKILSTYGKQL
ncbi:MAG: 3'-5' exonuclease [Lachnospiraceae bacterium]|nr:3'-5' exonuclease [Lachnospiraceae bacterium]